jgi:hypothetical protein
MVRKALTAIFVTVVLSGTLGAQQQEQPKPPERPQPDAPPTQTRQPPTRTQPVYLTGVVVMEDGSAPDMTMRVELVCSGRVRQQSHIMTNGGFSLTYGDQNPTGRYSDASVGAEIPVVQRRGRSMSEILSPGTNRADLRDCEVRLTPNPEFVANTIQLTDRGVLDSPDVGVIFVHRTADGPGSTVSATTLAAPRRARKAFEDALKRLDGKNVDSSRVMVDLERAVEEYEEFSAAWSLLGDVRLAAGDWDGAREAFERSIAGDPHYVRPYLALAEMAFRREDWEEVTAWTRDALDLNRSLPEGHYMRGVASFYLERFDEAEDSLEFVRRRGLVERYPATLLFLGIIHAGQGEVRVAAEEWGLYLALMPPDRVPEQQREGIEQRLAAWRREGLLDAPPAMGP